MQRLRRRRSPQEQQVHPCLSRRSFRPFQSRRPQGRRARPFLFCCQVNRSIHDVLEVVDGDIFNGFTMVPFGQGFRDMSPPTKELMRLVLERKLNHGGHPVLRWNMDNAFVRTDPAGNLKIVKERSTEKVDGAVALVMALDRALKNANSGASVYDDRGFLII